MIEQHRPARGGPGRLVGPKPRAGHGGHDAVGRLDRAQPGRVERPPGPAAGFVEQGVAGGREHRAAADGCDRSEPRRRGTVPKPLVNQAVSVGVLASITGSAPRGMNMNIALAAMADQFIAVHAAARHRGPPGAAPRAGCRRPARHAGTDGLPQRDRRPPMVPTWTSARARLSATAVPASRSGRSEWSRAAATRPAQRAMPGPAAGRVCVCVCVCGGRRATCAAPTSAPPR